MRHCHFNIYLQASKRGTKNHICQYHTTYTITYFFTHLYYIAYVIFCFIQFPHINTISIFIEKPTEILGTEIFFKQHNAYAVTLTTLVV